jgi:hypothetical protein
VATKGNQVTAFRHKLSTRKSATEYHMLENHKRCILLRTALLGKHCEKQLTEARSRNCNWSEVRRCSSHVRDLLLAAAALMVVCVDADADADAEGDSDDENKR